MKGRRLFIFIEGNDDERFFSRVVVPLFTPEYDAVELVMYACMKSEKVCKFIRTLEKMGHDYILVADIDQEPNARVKKDVIRERFCSIDQAHIMIIIKEIESWYLAGIDDGTGKKLGIHPLHSTDFVTKELFNRWIPRRYKSRILYMLEILDHFSVPVALMKNRSFRYFFSRYHLFEGSLSHPEGPEPPGEAQDASKRAEAA